jgi:AcrR family transcriptional regulator
MVAELEWVVPPQQDRSRETLERILAAAEALILERGLENVTVAQIAKRAGSSVGAFYARFPDKESLLRCVFQRFYEQAVATVDTVLASDRWADASARDLVASAMAFVVRVFREKRQLLVALTLRAARDPDLGATGQQIGERITVRIADLLRRRGDHVGHPNPEQAIGFAVWLVLSALNSRTLGTQTSDAVIPDAVIAGELTRMAISYLEIAEH